jgi:hypothetical protein
VRIVIEFEEHEPDSVVVQVTRERAQSATTTEAAGSTQDAGPARAEALNTKESDAVEVTDAGPAPESGADASSQ